MKNILLVVTLVLTSACVSDAKPFPAKALSIIVPYQPGGGTDAFSRAISDSAKTLFQVPINVINKPGGGGAIGMLEGANAKPDGYTITTLTVELVTLPYQNDIPLNKNLFQPLLMMNSAPAAITVPFDSPYNTIEDFLIGAKIKNLKVGNSGVGAIWHLSALVLEQKAGVKFNHIPFDGAGPAVKELLGKQIDAVSVSVSEVLSQVEAKQFKILAVMSEERLPSFPDVPTLKEKGFDIVFGTWRGLGVPKDTPMDIVVKLETTFKQAMESSDFITFMEKNSMDIDYLNSQDFAKKIDAEDLLFRDMMKEIKK